MFVFGYYHAAIVLNYQRNVFVNDVLDSLRDENNRLKRQVEILERKDKNCRCKLSVFNQLIYHILFLESITALLLWRLTESYFQME